MKSNDPIQSILTENLSGLSVSLARRAALYTDITGGRKMKKKLSLSLVLILVLMLVTLTALAMTAIPAWTDKVTDRTVDSPKPWLEEVADMIVDGVLDVWGLDEKARFVDAMCESGLTVDESLYAVLKNASLDGETRSDAADQIIDKYYGDRMRTHVAAKARPPATVVGMAPDESVIFRDAYDAEHPNATKQEHDDAYAYWSREIRRRRDAASEGLDKEIVELVDETAVIDSIKQLMIDDLHMTHDDIRKMNMQATYNQEYEVWVYRTIIPEAAILNPDNGFGLPQVGAYYRLDILVNKYGRMTINCAPNEYELYMGRTSVMNYSYTEVGEIALQGLTKAFGMSAEEADRYFAFIAGGRSSEDGYELPIVILKEHYNNNKNDWSYVVMVHAGTGEVLEYVDPPGLWAKLPVYAERLMGMTHAEQYLFFRWFLDEQYSPFGKYESWTAEQKVEWDALMGPYADQTSDEAYMIMYLMKKWMKK